MVNKSGIGTFVTEEHELATDSLDIFSLPQNESAMIHGKTQTFLPSGVITDNGPYEIIIPNDSNEFTMLQHTRIFGECEILQLDNDKLEATDAISVVNNFPQTLFRQIEIYLNNQSINDLSTPTYPYKTFIENHLTYDNDIKNTTLMACEMYVKDTCGTENNLTLALADTKSGFAIRKTKIVGKKIYFEMIPHVDFFQCPRFLIPGVEIKVRLIRNDDSFSLFSETAIGKIKMIKLGMKVRKITLDPAVASAVENKLNSNPAVYPITQSKIKTYLLNSGLQSQQISQIVRGKLPRSFIIGFVASKAFDGGVNTNPFCFEHFGLNYMNIFINGEPLHPQAIKPDFDNNVYLPEYRWFLDNIGLHQNASNNISYEDFKSNSCFFPYDLSPDLCNSYYPHGSENGTIDISIAFKDTLKQNVTLVFFATYDEAILIDKNRNISIV